MRHERSELWEERRLSALSSYDVLDTDPENDFDDVASLAARICGTPIAVVNFIGDRRQFFKAEVGLGVRSTPFNSSFCAKAILEADFLMIPDATKDHRFDCNPLVTGEPHLRFYAGAVLKTPDDLPIGTVCVLGYEPRLLDDLQQDTLRLLARQVMGQLELRKALKKKSQEAEAQRRLSQRRLAKTKVMAQAEEERKRTSSNPRDIMHDEPYAAACIVKTILEANGAVQGYSYWTFSDIFEENYFPSVPFYGGFGLPNIHGIPKPAYRAFQLLHELGTQMLPVEGCHETVDAWFVRGNQHSTLMLTNFALPRHPIITEQVSFTLKSAPCVTTASIQRIDLGHANATRHWELMGKPDYVSPEIVDRLKCLSRLQSEPIVVRNDTGALMVDVAMPPHSVAAIHFSI